MKIKKMLLATDLSKDSERQYAAVAKLAKGVGASITLLHVVKDLLVPAMGAPMAPALPPIDNTRVVARSIQVLGEHARKLGDGYEVKCEVIEGPSVATAITEYASANDFDLLAIGTHGRSGVRRLMLGSVAENVLRSSSVPVLCFPHTDLTRKNGRTAIEHILITTDLSSEALRSFKPVLELAETLGCRVTVLHVVPEFHTIPSGVPGHRSPKIERGIVAARSSVVDQCAALGDGVDLAIQVISHESPAEGIVEFAKEHKVDVIALSTHGRTGFRRLMLGSVAEEVLRHSSVPVLSFHRDRH